MQKKQIGFIDYHLDEWHANNYPAWFRTAARADEFELGYAWEESPATKEGGIPQAEWCKKFDMKSASSLEEVVEKSDCICVLAPSNPEVHARLAKIPLESGKPLYIDKTFAPDKATAESFFATARAHGTPLMSSSALRYGSEFQAVLQKKDLPPTRFVLAIGGGRPFQEYSIHQIEMVVAALGTGAKCVHRTTTGSMPHYVIEYADGIRSAMLTYDRHSDFMVLLQGDRAPDAIPSSSRTFENLIDAMLEFFATGVSPIPAEETIEIAAIRAAAIQAENAPGKIFAV